MNRIDDLLNKYIDNEISQSELEEMQFLLKDESNVKKLKALQLVNTSLKKLESYSAPEAFTLKAMAALSNKFSKAKSKTNHYAEYLLSVLGLIIAATVLFILFSADWSSTDNSTSQQITKAMDVVKNNVPGILSFFKNKSVMTLGLSLSMIFLIIAYYSVEAHKSFKKRISKLTS